MTLHVNGPAKGNASVGHDHDNHRLFQSRSEYHPPQAVLDVVTHQWETTLVDRTQPRMIDQAAKVPVLLCGINAQSLPIVNEIVHVTPNFWMSFISFLSTKASLLVMTSPLYSMIKSPLAKLLVAMTP